MKFHIETERLLLRELRLTDLEGMFALDSDPEVHKYLGNKPVKTIDESRKILESVLTQYKERGIGRFAVIEKSTGDFVGWSGLRLNTEYNMNGYTKYYDVGYRLIKSFWGKGYATESGKASVDYAFNVLKLPEIYATTEIENEASHNALLKLGLHYVEDFYFEQEQMNLRWYTLKKEDYAKKMS
ncbi:GNAT family N-acetyltransferase [Lacinutrix sp. C3R15]|uniref:GNAT family N-acetyltransferase n=1 Tax=Flavobacteriaceae TaxID=49546 RepID=UPI001C090061|nr:MULTISPECIES: GNAT family N-acetyltransferase [Flavobacteriaceae]MBU2938230.1 GNAT family N-acetyltransferase [Lacinutrix sp. C3R15]MDO6621544.1 GNAT family N-acetyltransferase [Oceanihabitans sp. 1_MG-2023]